MNSDKIFEVKVNFDFAEQKKRQTHEWTLLSRAASASPLTLAVKLIIGVLAIAAAVVFFIFTDEGNKFGIAAVTAIVIAAICISGAVTDMALTRIKRKKTLAKLDEHLKETFGKLPETCEMTFTFGNNVTITAEDTVTAAEYSECYAVEFENFVAVDFGDSCCYCFSSEELGDKCARIKKLLKKHGERYQYLLRKDFGAYRLEIEPKENSQNAAK